MKSNKILMVGAAALACASLASAATTLKITGSTAYRNSTTSAIIQLMNANGGYKAAYVSTDVTPTEGALKKAKFSVFQGNITGADNPVTIQCAWAGSVGGIDTVVNNRTLANSWIDVSELPGSNGILTGASIDTFESASTADATMSDTLQSTTLFPTPGLNSRELAIVPFVWMKNNGFPSSVTNITSLQARALLQGFSPLSIFTGDNADAGTFVLAVGRDQDSGTRVAALADSGYGALTNPLQWRINISGSQVVSAEPFPATTLFGITYEVGTTGYDSGGKVVAALNATDSITKPVKDENGDEIVSGAYYIGYAGTGDAKSLTGHTQNSTTGVFTATGDLQVLTYNGVPYSFQNVIEGKYTFWTVEHILSRFSAATNVATVITKLGDEIEATATDGIKLSDMHVSRSVEGGVITHN
jgi:hypothetical protein